MAIVVTNIGRVGDTGNDQIQGCDLDQAPAANTLVLVTVCWTDTAGTSGPPSAVASDSLVFTKVDEVQYDSPSCNLTVWRSMSASPDASRITANYTGTGNSTGCTMLVDQISGVSTSGTSGANAVGQSSTSSTIVNDNVLTVLAPGSAASTANAWFAVQSAFSTEVAVPNNDYQQSGTTGTLTPDFHAISAYTLLSTGTRVTWSASGVDARGAIIVELVAHNPAGGGGGAVPSPYYATYYYPQVVAQC